MKKYFHINIVWLMFWLLIGSAGVLFLQINHRSQFSPITVLAEPDVDPEGNGEPPADDSPAPTDEPTDEEQPTDNPTPTSVGPACDLSLSGYERVKNTLENAQNFTLDDLGCFIGGLVTVLLLFAQIIAVIWIIVSGIQYISSLGDPEKMAGAKKALLWAVVGLIISMCAYAIIKFVELIF